ncbi:MAG: hypothetical protein K0B11_21415 [Mariniphaga sp.]|nr:hypothetical protein [Mariniphaga sp.]
MLEILNEKEEALEQINKAIEIDPLFFMYRILKSGYNYRDGNYDVALEARLESEEFYPGFSSRGYYYFLIYYKLGKDQKAIESLQKILANDSTTIKFVNTVTDVYSNSGMNGILNWIIDLEQQKVPPNYLRIANWHCLLGEKEPALNWLERAVEERAPDIPRMNCSRDLNILRDEPRFNTLIEKMGLTPYAIPY